MNVNKSPIWKIKKNFNPKILKNSKNCTILKVI